MTTALAPRGLVIPTDAMLIAAEIEANASFVIDEGGRYPDGLVPIRCWLCGTHHTELSELKCRHEWFVLPDREVAVLKCWTCGWPLHRFVVRTEGRCW